MVFAFVLMTATICHSAGSRSESWMKYEKDKKGFGYEHLVISKKGGLIEHEMRRLTKTSLMGLTDEDFAEEGFFVTDENFFPKSFKYKYDMKQKHFSAEGSRENEIMRIRVNQEDGGAKELKLSLKDTYFDVNFARIIWNRRNESTFEVVILNSMTMQIETMPVAITKVGKSRVEAKTRVSGIYTVNMVIDDSGQLVSSNAVEANIRIRKTNKKDALDIKPLKASDGFMLIVKSKKDFGNVFKVKKARIQVKWKNIPFDEFRLEDNRQKLLEKKCVNNEYEVILGFSETVKAPAASIPAKYEGELKRYLADGEYIKPSDEAIREMALKIKGDEKDPRMIVKKIIKWMTENIKVDFISETLTGPEVLKKKCGKCTEFSTLFASLARSLGIPVRIALGERHGGGVWLGHMWVEVFIDGQWLAVEADGGFIEGPTHIKLVDGADVTDTQKVRMKLIDNLGVEVLDFDEEADTSAVDIKTGILGDTYFNRNFKCKISSPGAGWKIEEKQEAGATMVMVRKTKPKLDATLVLFNVPPGTSAKMIMEMRIKVLSARLKDFKKLEDREVKIKNSTYYFMRFESTTITTGIRLLQENYLLIDGSNAYLMTLIAEPDDFKKHNGDLDKIFDSFELIK
jgi:hypothetical protein